MRFFLVYEESMRRRSIDYELRRCYFYFKSFLIIDFFFKVRLGGKVEVEIV